MTIENGMDRYVWQICLRFLKKVRPMVSDYKMNLLQLRASETCDFQDPEVDAVFDISRSIYGDLEGSDHRK